MKKNLLKIAVIIFAVIFLLLLLDYVCYCTFLPGYKQYNLKTYFNSYIDKNVIEIDNKYILDKQTKRNYRPIENPDSKLEPILLFGFSSVYGLNLKNNETISYFLKDVVKNPIINRTKAEFSPNHMYYQLSNPKFYKIVKKPKYILYFYTPKQFVLTNNKLDFCQHDVYYKIKNNTLERYEKIPIIKKSYLIAKINLYLFRNKTQLFFTKKNQFLFEKILIESKRITQSHWGDTFKFIIIVCCKPGNKKEEQILQKLEKENFIIFNLYEYINFYDFFENGRPSAKYWLNVARVLKEKLFIE